MGTKWRGDERRAYVRPKRDALPIVAAIVLLVVASAVHFALFPLNAGASTTSDVRTFTNNAGDGTIVFVRVRGAGCLEAEDSTRLRLKRYVPSEHLAVYRCVTP